jgi:hypothetical protein
MAAAVGFLLDLYQPGWKGVVEREGTARGLFAHLSEALGIDPASRSALVERARKRYGWEDLLSASRALVTEYLTRFDRALAAFDAQGGTRIVVRVPILDLTRSRSSRTERLVGDAGRRILGQFTVYRLRRSAAPPLELSINGADVLDELDEKGYRVVTFHIAEPIVITADGQTVSGETEGNRVFRTLSFETRNVTFRTGLAGALRSRPGEVRIDVEPPTGK